MKKKILYKQFSSHLTKDFTKNLLDMSFNVLHRWIHNGTCILSLLTTLIDNMDNVNTPQSICGCNITLPVDRYKHELVSKGEANSDCSVTMMVGLSSEFSCKICVHTVEWIMEADDVMNITFIVKQTRYVLNMTYEQENKNILYIKCCTCCFDVNHGLNTCSVLYLLSFKTWQNVLIQWITSILNIVAM